MPPPDPRSVTDVDRVIGERLRERRKELGYSQAYVASLIGITFQQMQKYEAGQNRVASATLLRLAEVMKTDPMSLLPATKPPRAVKHDPSFKQLQKSFQEIETPRERRMVVEMARKLAGSEAPKKSRAKARRR